MHSHRYLCVWVCVLCVMECRYDCMRPYRNVCTGREQFSNQHRTHFSTQPPREPPTNPPSPPTCGRKTCSRIYYSPLWDLYVGLTVLFVLLLSVQRESSSFRSHENKNTPYIRSYVCTSNNNPPDGDGWDRLNGNLVAVLFDDKRTSKLIVGEYTTNVRSQQVFVVNQGWARRPGERSSQNGIIHFR